MNRRESVIIAIVFVVITLPLIYVKSNQWIEGYMDTAQLAQITENVATKGIPLNYLIPSQFACLQRHIPTLPAEQACKVDLSPPQVKVINYLKFHAHLILYLIAPLARVIPVDILWPALTVLAFMGLLALTYLFLRRSGVPIMESTLFCLLVSFHPAWSQGLFVGQEYVDRLFFLFGALFIYACVHPAPRKLEVLLYAFLSALINERIGVTVALFILGYAALYWRECVTTRKFYVVTGIIILAFSLGTIRFYLDNFYYATFLPASPSDLISRFSLPGFAEKLGIFLFINLGMLGVFALFNPRGFVLALMVMLPNVIGNIGGAEKTGWSTHYHSLYFPILVWVSASGFVYLSKKRPSLPFRATLSAATLSMIILFGAIDPYAPFEMKSVRFGHLVKNAWPRLLTLFPDYWNDARRHQIHFVYDQLATVIPENSIVSAPEFAFPSLHKRRTLYLYPIGLDVADYAIQGVVSYLGPENEASLDKCLLGRMKDDGYDVDNPLWAGSVKVFRRSTSPVDGRKDRALSDSTVINDSEDVSAFRSSNDSALESQTISLNDNPLYISSGKHSLRKRFITNSEDTIHYGGILIQGVSSQSFAFDFWLDTKCRAPVMFLFLMDEEEKVVAQYMRNLTNLPFPNGVKQTVYFINGVPSPGFDLISADKLPTRFNLKLLLDVCEKQCEVNYYIDNLRAVTRP